MRDLAILSIFAYGCFLAFKRPYIGAMVMLWISYMNPHRLVPWGLTYSLPLYALAFCVTFLAFLISKDKHRYPLNGMSILMIIFVLWGGLCTVFALEPEWATSELSRFSKILLGVALYLMIMRGEHKIKMMVLVMAVATAFYGVKGGIFAIMTGGNFRVWGPPDSFIEGNNELALALLMTIPLLFFLFTDAKHKWLKRAYMASIGLCFISVVASYSRGAFLALAVTSFFLWLKSRFKVPLAVLGIVAVLGAIPFIPQHWYDRMNTIQTYEQDASAMGRINAWTVAVNVANDRITGGGYGHWGPRTFAMYAPIPDKVHDAHSIYFEVLGELGWPGLLMFLSLLLICWRMNGRNIKLSDGRDDLLWCNTLAKMLQVSQIAYMSGGAFLGLAYWNMPYHLMVVTILLNLYLKERAEAPQQSEEQDGEVVAPKASTKYDFDPETGIRRRS
ncbi:putative O-glycosylation ligase, exosortase A system-associated [Aestuariibacter halophilus]|uniref:O-glycosylation ligase, exosortase A system-associated n=1 Tax=Fluctibacter halophilus TaxID=226011 RepID=A0ABS8G2V6_9ALTE|nr:putative O-glycosylation ligase, exosortase A system-associated [Aestuariibacter halophilus]MCC2614863.1 putative O-glycosylation ligase, exosortase A system-associated [Aestuariibacter halophilus]